MPKVVPSIRDYVRGGVGVLLALAFCAVTFAVVPPASADTTPPGGPTPANPQTMAADALPTVQIDGIVWTQYVLGNTVYVGGEFTTARPAGAAPGQNTTPRANLLAYDIRTGELIDSWAPTTNGSVYSITASPDRSRIYVGGSFTQFNGRTKNRIAAVHPATGETINAFNVYSDASIRAILPVGETVYLGGLTTNLNGVARSRVGAVRASDGALLDWAPQASGGTVRALALSPDGSSVVVGGSFTSMNGSSNPGYGLAALDPATAANRSFPANSVLRNGGTNGAITTLSTDNDSIYIGGYAYGRSSTLEGVSRVDSGGNIKWIEDCHGDTYSAVPLGDTVYVASHQHYCGNMPGGWAQNSPHNYYHLNAFSKVPTGTLRKEYFGYTDYSGRPSPSLLHYYPRLTVGSYSGQNQAAWTVDANSDYVVAGGEFPDAGDGPQQGLVRFARSGIAPNLEGPEVSGSRANPTVTSPASGEAVVSWQANWDRDNQDLTYRVMRNGAPVHTVRRHSSEFDRPYLSFRDTGLAPGDTPRYRIFATDPFGNEARSDSVEVTVSGSGATDDYARAVTGDGPMHFWRLDETAGTTLRDYVGRADLTTSGTVTRGNAGALPGSTAVGFTGSPSTAGTTATAQEGPYWFSVEAWVKTTTRNGGKIIGFGNASSGNSSTFDRHLYMLNDGRVAFGTRQGSSNNVATSPSAVNDGQWHQVAATVGDRGMYLYIDGQQVATRLDTRAAQAFKGQWRVGGDNIGGSWSGDPTSDYLSGEIDEVAVYRHELTGNQFRSHYLASGRSQVGSATKPTDAYGSAVYESGADSYWRMAETSGATAADSSLNGNTGSYVNSPALGGASALGRSDDRSVSFDGSNDYVSANRATTGPDTWSAETWFRTGTTRGGKLIGFGSSRTGTSTTVDRHLYMTDAGLLAFGTVGGSSSYVLSSAQSYNDDVWHHAVISQGPNGMRLYVDGVMVAQNSETLSRAYTGYWRFGGDSLVGWPARPSSDYFSGSLDEAATYTRVLTAGEVSDHFAKGGGEVPNAAPTAAFTAQVDDLDVTFSSSGSRDSDGTISSYAWDFGDGQASSAANPTHAYAEPGSYDVTLVVTDGEGATGSVTKEITTSSPAPTAAFTVSVSDLKASFDSSGSSDADGPIASYTWSFGDGQGSTQANPVHTYAQAGTYDVTLVVTDSDGRTDSASRQVTASEAPPAGILAQDTFSRSVAGGWGVADNGGPWTLSGPANRFAVANGVGTIALNAPGNAPGTLLEGISVLDSDVTAKIGVDKVADGGGAIVSVGGRKEGSESYRAKVKIGANGRVTLYLTRVVAGVESTLSSVLLSADTTLTANEMLNVRLQIEGSSPTNLRAKAWEVGTAEPGAWQLTSTNSAPELQDAGGYLVATYLSGSATNAPIRARVDDLVVRSLGGEVTPPANDSPAAAFTADSTGLAVDFDGSPSSDPDGSVTAYDWDFGDGARSTASAPRHTYAAAGTYTVTLTVTDNQGATGTKAANISVSEPAGDRVVAQDDFNRVASGGWGSALLGGAWTLSGPANRFSVNGDFASIAMNAPGNSPGTLLEGVSRLNTEVSALVGLDTIANGGGAFVSLGARKDGGDAYRTKVKFAANGRVTLYLVRMLGGAETTLSTVTLPSSVTMAGGEMLQVRMQVEGQSPTTLRARAWKAGTTEPSGWQLTSTDSAATLQDAGGYVIATYLSGSATNAPIIARIDDFLAQTLP